MQFVKDVALLREFGLNPRIWIAYKQKNRKGYHDGYCDYSDIDETEGYPFIIKIPRFAKGKPMGRFTKKDIIYIRQVNRCFNSTDNTVTDSDIVKKVMDKVNERGEYSDEFLCSRTGLLYRPAMPYEMPEKKLQGVFNPTLATYNNAPDFVCLVDENTGVSANYRTHEEHYKLQAYAHLEGLQEVLDEVSLRETMLTLAGESVDEPINAGLIVSDGNFKVDMLGSYCRVSFKTPDKGCMYVKYNLSTNTVQGKFNTVERILSLESNKTYHPITTMLHPALEVSALYCSSIEYTNGVLRILVRCRVRHNADYFEYADLPIQFLSRLYVNYDQNPRALRLTSTHFELIIPNALIPCIDTSGELEDYLSPRFLEKASRVTDYIGLKEEF